MSKKKFASVVIAAFNEVKNIEILTKKIVETLSKKFEYEIIYVIAGTDGTLEVLKTLQKKNKKIHVIYSEKPSGLGLDFKKGFSKISKKADFVITMDADLNHDPYELDRFFKYADDYDIVVGSRHIKGGKRINYPKWKLIVSDLTNLIFSRISEISISDKTSGYRVYKIKVLKELAKRYKSKNYEYLMETLLIGAKLGYSMKEVPITFTYRVHGRSKFQLIRESYCYLKLVSTYRNKK